MEFYYIVGDNMFFKYKRNNKEDLSILEVEQIKKVNPNCILLDVRSVQEYREGHLKNSINIPLYNIKTNSNLKFCNKDSIIIVYCQSGVRSKKAIKILRKNGYNNLYNLKGGLNGI